jgi:putative ABC transport system permease protein
MTGPAGLGRRIRAGLITATGTAAGPSLVLAFLVVASVFVAIATPRASLAFRTKALQQVIDSTPPAGQTVTASVGMPTFGGALGPIGQPEYNDMNSAAFIPVGNELARHIRALGLPLRPGAAWWSASTAYVPAPGAAKSAYNGSTEPQVELLDRPDLGTYGKLVAGTLPTSAGDRLRPAVARFDVAVTTGTAARFGLRVGSTVGLADTSTGAVSKITLVVTGIVRAVRPRSAFWTADPDALRPSFNKTEYGGYWLGAMLISDSELDDLETAVTDTQIQITWEFPLNLSGVSANQVGALNTELNDGLPAVGVVTKSVVTPLALSLSSALGGAVAQFAQTEGQIGSLLALAYVSLTIVGLAVLLLGARLLAERRVTEFGLIRARGAARWQLALLAGRAGLIVVVPAAGAGALLAIAVTPGQNEPLAWWLAGITVAVALAGVPWLAVRQVWGTGLIDERADGAVPRPARLRRLVADVAAVAAAVGGLVVLRRQGPSAAGTDWFTSAAPVLVAIPMAIVVVRVYPVVLRWLVALAGRRPGVTTFIGLARAARASAAAVLPAFALVLALAVIAFGAMLRGAVVNGDVAQSWRQVGADAVIDASGSNAPLTLATQRALAAVPGVRAAAAAAVTSGTAADGSTLAVVVLNPAAFRRFLGQTPAAPFPAAALSQPPAGAGGGPIPALGSPGSGAAFAGGGKLLIGISAVRVRDVGRIGSLAGVPGEPDLGAFVVIPQWAADRYMGADRPAPNLMLFAGPVDPGRLRSAVTRLLPGATTITFRSAALAALTNAALPHGAYVTFAQTGVAAAGFGAIIMAIMLALGARRREMTLARLATMGLSQGQARRLVVTESLPAIIAATIGGAVCAWLLVPILAPSIDLAVFTGSTAPVPVQANFAVIGYLAAGLVVLALATLFAQAAATRLRGVSRALRVGE